MRVLVCGGRDFRDRDLAYTTLDNLHFIEPITHIIQGGASGADFLAFRWAENHFIPSTEYRADWNANGRAAGPIRNQRMIDEGKPDFVVAFRGGRGTADMLRRAKAAGIKTTEIQS